MKTRLKAIYILSIFIFSMSLVVPLTTFAVVPNAVDVTIYIRGFKNLESDGDWIGAGDIYFEIEHTTTATSGTATNDYEDDSDYHSLSNPDFDGLGYYDKYYGNLRFGVDQLTWNIRVYDDDLIGRNLLFEGEFKVKQPSTTGSRYHYPYTYAWIIWVPASQQFLTMIYGTNNDDCSFTWKGGKEKNDIYNGLELWVLLNFKQI